MCLCVCICACLSMFVCNSKEQLVTCIKVREKLTECHLKNNNKDGSASLLMRIKVQPSDFLTGRGVHLRRFVSQSRNQGWVVLEFDRSSDCHCTTRKEAKITLSNQLKKHTKRKPQEPPVCTLTKHLLSLSL